MFQIPATLVNDGYKIGHVVQYPDNTDFIYANFTPRSLEYSPTQPYNKDKIVVAGIQILTKVFLSKYWEDNFFNRPREEVVEEYREFVQAYQSIVNFNADHIGKLHDLGYLPIEVKALKEGTISNVKVPILTMRNTVKGFAWVVGFLEDMVSFVLWKPTTVATIAYSYRKLLEAAYDKVGITDKSFIDYQCHDFSLRGMSGLQDAQFSGIGHLINFTGSDNLPAIWTAKKVYSAEGFVAGGVPASEHSVMCAGGEDTELETYTRMLELYPEGLLSLVSDTWDFFGVVGNDGILSKLKDKIMNRNGKLVIRPDSGDPVEILCGIDIIEVDSVDDAVEELIDKVYDETDFGRQGEKYYEGIFKINGSYHKVTIEVDWDRYGKTYYYVDDYQLKSCEKVELTDSQKGAVECLWDLFGGTVTENGLKTLDSHIGLIYGDSITLERCDNILKRLVKKGFSPTNVVFGVGSFTYQHITRDTLGFAMKCTQAVINGEEVVLQKNPKTDRGLKKSAKGLLSVHKEDDKLVLRENQTEEEANQGLLEVVFLNGKVVREETLEEIRARLK